MISRVGPLPAALTLLALMPPLKAESAVFDGSGRMAAMLFQGQDAQVRTDLVLPSPGWRQTLSLGSAEGLTVSRGDVSRWSGRLAFDSSHKLEFTQTVREEDRRIIIAVNYKALHDLSAEGLFFRLNIPWLDFQNGAANIGARSVTLPENAANNTNLLSGATAQLDARSASGNVWWGARFSQSFNVNLQDKSGESPKSYTFWVYVWRGSLPAGATGDFEITLTLDGVPDTSTAALTVDPSQSRYLLHGFGGNYCFQIESPLTDYTLENLNVRWARAEMSLADWNGPDSDKPGTRLRGEMQLMRRLQDKGIPYIASSWRLPERLLADRGAKGPNDQQRRIDPDLWIDLLDHIASYLVHAKETYGVEPDLFSFNEPELGIRILFTAEEHRRLILDLGAKFEGLGLKTRMLLGDVSNPRGTIAFTRPAAQDPDALRYVGAVSFHSWGGASAAQYREWGDLAESLGIPLLVAEMGTDASGWQGRAYDSYWYGIEELRQYQELLLHARPQATIYWEFTADYALARVTPDGIAPTGRFWLTKHFTDLTPPMSQALASASDHGKVLVTAFHKDGAYTVHIANTSAARNAALTGLPKEIAAWRGVLTTEEIGFAEQPELNAEDGGLALTLPARSLLTLRAAPTPTAPPDNASSTPRTPPPVP